MKSEFIVGFVLLFTTATGICYNIWTFDLVNFLLWAIIAIAILITESLAPDPYGDDEGF